jgi:acetyltransferase-like isoleucine patch superfamily enzyme
LLERLREKLKWLPYIIGYQRGPLLASALRKRWVILRHPLADIRFGKDCYLGPGFSLHIPGRGTFIAHEGVEFRRNFRCEIVDGGRVEIGKGSYLTYGVVIGCSTSIEIGERCGIGMACCVYDGNHRYRDLDKAFLNQGYEFRPVRIENDAQVHNLCTVVNSIGERAVIGANSVVLRPVPAYTLTAGVPARVIDYFGPPGQEPDGWTPRESREVSREAFSENA